MTIHEKKNIIKHRCVVCGFEKNNGAAGNDGAEALIALSAKHD